MTVLLAYPVHSTVTGLARQSISPTDLNLRICRVWSNLSEVGLIVDHLMPDVVDRVDDILACPIVLGLKWHRTMSVPYKWRGSEKTSVSCKLVRASTALCQRFQTLLKSWITITGKKQWKQWIRLVTLHTEVDFKNRTTATTDEPLPKLTAG